MNARVCICGKPVLPTKRGRERSTCGDRSCRARASVNVRFRPSENVVHWPHVTGPIIADFSGQELTFKRQWLGQRLAVEDMRRSFTGCSGAML